MCSTRTGLRMARTEVSGSGVASKATLRRVTTYSEKACFTCHATTRKQCAGCSECHGGTPTCAARLGTQEICGGVRLYTIPVIDSIAHTKTLTFGVLARERLAFVPPDQCSWTQDKTADFRQPTLSFSAGRLLPYCKFTQRYGDALKKEYEAAGQCTRPKVRGGCCQRAACASERVCRSQHRNPAESR
jgi:hypothetical protein